MDPSLKKIYKMEFEVSWEKFEYGPVVRYYRESLQFSRRTNGTELR
jgi:hypothetical protein